MVRQKRIYYNNAVYHVVFRGNNKQMILKEHKDKEALLITLSKFKERFNFKLFGFVIMDNHAHLLIGTNHLNSISKIMQAVLLSFSFKFRKRYNYSGHVWEGRFKSNAIDGDAYIQECLEYMHNNPVRANIVTSAVKYSWSSCCFYNGFDNEVLFNKINLDKYGDTSFATN
jgi:REP element-mobilizing transposase RayT